MQHRMRLEHEAFERLVQGTKILELRLYDEKRQTIEPGDEIVFADNLSGRCTCTKVIGLLRYATFETLITDVPATWLGYQESDKPYLKSSMYEIYTPQDEARYGVLGLRMQLVNEAAPDSSLSQGR